MLVLARVCDALSVPLLSHAGHTTGAALTAQSDGVCNAVGHPDVHHDDEQQLLLMLMPLQTSPLPLLIPPQMQSLMGHAASQLPNQRW